VKRGKRRLLGKEAGKEKERKISRKSCSNIGQKGEGFKKRK